MEALSQDNKSVVFCTLDINLNFMILEALLHGVYTGIVAVTLWIIFSSESKRLHSTFPRAVIITLYVLSTIAFAIDWAFEHYAFIEHGNNYYSVFTALEDSSLWWNIEFFIGGITGGISTLLVDIIMIWRCWILWDYQWRMVFIPILCAVAETVVKIMDILTAFNSTDDTSKIGIFVQEVDWSLIYVSLTLITTVICTLLIVYRIVHLAQRVFLFRNIISALIESSAMYTLALVVYLALVVRNTVATDYADIIAVYIRAISPTFLMLRVSARSDSSSDDEESTPSRALSDIQFGPMGSEDTSDLNFSGSHGTGTTESV